MRTDRTHCLETKENVRKRHKNLQLERDLGEIIAEY